MPDTNPDTKPITIPEREEFDRLYTSIDGLNKATVEAVGGNITRITTQTAGITVGLDFILELMADKYNSRPPLDTGMALTGKPPFIENLDEILTKKMDWIQTQFQNVLRFDEQKIDRICYDYYRIRAHLLLTRIEYLKWKESHIGYLIKDAVRKVELEKDQETTKIRGEYRKKADSDRVRALNEITQIQTENKRLISAMGLMDAQIQQMVQEKQMYRKDLEIKDVKLRDTERNADDWERKVAHLTDENKKLTEKLERYKVNTKEWTQASNKDNKPVWKNTITKEVIPLPVTIEEFQRDYQLVSAENGKNIYENTEGDTLELPESLGDALMEEEEAENSTETDAPPQNNQRQSKRTDKRLRPNDLKIMKISSDKPISQEEISKLTGIPLNNVTTYTSRLLLWGHLKEGYDGNTKVYTKSIPGK